MSHKSHNPNGREVLVYEGKEITRAQTAEFTQEELDQVKLKVNGPHHSAKWARDLTDKLFPNNLRIGNIVMLRNIVIHA